MGACVPQLVTRTVERGFGDLLFETVNAALVGSGAYFVEC